MYLSADVTYMYAAALLALGWQPTYLVTPNNFNFVAPPRAICSVCTARLLHP